MSAAAWSNIADPVVKNGRAMERLVSPGSEAVRPSNDLSERKMRFVGKGPLRATDVIRTLNWDVVRISVVNVSLTTFQRFLDPAAPGKALCVRGER